jgi:hypothetical protein
VRLACSAEHGIQLVGGTWRPVPRVQLPGSGRGAAAGLRHPPRLLVACTATIALMGVSRMSRTSRTTPCDTGPLQALAVGDTTTILSSDVASFDVASTTLCALRTPTTPSCSVDTTEPAAPGIVAGFTLLEAAPAGVSVKFLQGEITLCEATISARAAAGSTTLRIGGGATVGLAGTCAALEVPTCTTLRYEVGVLVLVEVRVPKLQ